MRLAGHPICLIPALLALPVGAWANQCVDVRQMPVSLAPVQAHEARHQVMEQIGMRMTEDDYTPLQIQISSGRVLQVALRLEPRAATQAIFRVVRSDCGSVQMQPQTVCQLNYNLVATAVETYWVQHDDPARVGRSTSEEGRGSYDLLPSFARITGGLLAADLDIDGGTRFTCNQFGFLGAADGLAPENLRLISWDRTVTMSGNFQRQQQRDELGVGARDLRFRKTTRTELELTAMSTRGVFPLRAFRGRFTTGTFFEPRVAEQDNRHVLTVDRGDGAVCEVELAQAPNSWVQLNRPSSAQTHYVQNARRISLSREQLRWLVATSAIDLDQGSPSSLAGPVSSRLRMLSHAALPWEAVAAGAAATDFWAILEGPSLFGGQICSIGGED